MENRKINYCPKCGNKLTGGERFCSICGNPLLDNFQTENMIVSQNYEKKDEEKKSLGKLKKILLGIGAVVVMVVIVIALSFPQESEETVKVPEAESAEEQLNSEKNADGLKTSKSQLDIIGTITNIGTVDPKFELSSNQTEFIQSHLELFPASNECLDELSQYIDTTLDYSHMIKNPKDISGRFAFMEQLTVQQIWEENFGEGPLSCR